MEVRQIKDLLTEEDREEFYGLCKHTTVRDLLIALVNSVMRNRALIRSIQEKQQSERRSNGYKAS